MKKMPAKDLYSILGVVSTATDEEIRTAYIARARIIHPDRFDRQQQLQDWRQANEMLAELNEAYSILRNSLSRAQYDDLRFEKSSQRAPSSRAQSDSKSSSSPAFELGELTCGQAAFMDLPKKVQSRLLKRQQNKGEDQFLVKLSSVVWSYIFIVILLSWFCFLFFDVDGVKWEDDTILWYIVISLAVGGFIGRNIVTILKWSKANLKPCFYVTPIYFIKTEFDIVSFRPVWSLKDIAVTHNYKNGSYRNSDVVLKFEGYTEFLCISSKQKVEALLTSMRTFDTRMRTAFANRDHNYFLNNDDFLHVTRTGGVPTTVLISKRIKFSIYIAAMIVCEAGLLAAIVTNNVFSQKQWIRHPAPASSISREFDDVAIVPKRTSSSSRSFNFATPSYTEQTLPYSGSIRTWENAECVAPFKIEASQGCHYLLKLVNAYSGAPIMTVFVRSGATVAIEVPLGTYEVRYASGKTWYGYEYLFGPETLYSKADRTFTFEIVGNQVNGVAITLYRVAHGNLHTSKIEPTEF